MTYQAGTWNRPDAKIESLRTNGDPRTVGKHGRGRDTRGLSLMQADSTPPRDRPVFIYSLTDPFTLDVRYIGKSIRPDERLTNHCNDRSHCHRTHWIQSVIARGARPLMGILEELPPGADWQAAERRWIAHARAEGWPLTNSTSGGDGVCDLPAESRERMRRTWIGRKHSAETRAKIGAKSRGRKHPQEWREYMSEKMRTRVFTPEHRMRLSRAVSKLTQEQADEIRRLLAQGYRQTVLAEMFGVHKGTISNIKRGKFYR